jgi:hypothetical protein
MKKVIKVLSGTVVALILLAVVAGTALAAGPHYGSRDGNGVRDLVNKVDSLGFGMALGFVDEDSDGVNDRYLSEPQFVDEDGDDLCDLGESEFVDEDGDGLCDLHGGTQNPDDSYSYAYSDGYRSANSRSGRHNYSGTTGMNGDQDEICVTQ